MPKFPAVGLVLEKNKKQSAGIYINHQYVERYDSTHTVSINWTWGKQQLI